MNPHDRADADTADDGHDPRARSHRRAAPDSIFSYQELARLDEALTMSSRETGLRFTLYIGDLGSADPGDAPRSCTPAPAATPRRVGADRRLARAAGAWRSSPARRPPAGMPDRACALAVLSMTGSFAAGDLVGGIVNGLRQMSDQAGHPAALRHPY